VNPLEPASWSWLRSQAFGCPSEASGPWKLEFGAGGAMAERFG